MMLVEKTAICVFSNAIASTKKQSGAAFALRHSEKCLL